MKDFMTLLQEAEVGVMSFWFLCMVCRSVWTGCTTCRRDQGQDQGQDQGRDLGAGQRP